MSFKALINLILENNPDIQEIRNSRHKPLDLLILLILNQSTSDDLADLAFKKLKLDYPDYKTILAENNPEKLTESIKICGLSKSKSVYILNTLNYLEKQNWLDINLNFINDLSDAEALEALTQIKGIGIKSASCLLMFSFKRGTFPIDTHLFRIFKRLGNIIPANIDLVKAHKLLQPQIQGKLAFQVHVALIELGRKVCLGKTNPKCSICYLNSICQKNFN